MNHALRAVLARRSWLVVLLLGGVGAAPAVAQEYDFSSNELMWMNGDYHSGGNLSALAFGIDWAKGDGAPGWAWQLGVTFGTATGTYGGELSSSVIRDEASRQMQGSTLERYETPDETDGGFMVGGKALILFYSYTNTAIGVGPRLSYYTGHEISVLTVSTGGGYEYTEFAQVPYTEPTLIPGIEVQIQPGTEFGFRYAYFFRGADEPAMHMFGVGWAWPM